MYLGEREARELAEVGIKGADNGKKGGKERESISMIDRCHAIVKTARMNFHIRIRATQSSRRTSCRSWPFHHRFGNDVTSISIT